MDRRQFQRRSGFLSAAFVVFFSSVTLAQTNLPRVNFDLTTDFDVAKDSFRITGEVSFSGLPSSEVTCFVLSYNDPDYGLDRRHNKLEFMNRHTEQVRFTNGRTEARVLSGQKVIAIEPYLIRLEGSSQRVRFQLDSQVPRLPKADPNLWYLGGFYPRPLSQCPEASLNTSEYTPLPHLEQRGKIQVAKGWRYIGINSGGDQSITVSHNARQLMFALGRDDYQTAALEVGDTAVYLHYRSDEMRDLLPDIKATILAMEDQFGLFPFPALHIVETKEVLRFGMPGLIGFNMPRQFLFQKLQRDFINWRQWVIAQYVAAQWFGGALGEASPADRWLNSGFVDLAADEALRRNVRAFNLINPFDNGFRLLSFTYRQAQDVMASALRQFSPFSQLTDKDLVTKDDYSIQNPIMFIRHTMALRHIRAMLGRDEFNKIMRRFMVTYQYRTVSPREFVEFLAHDSGYKSKRQLQQVIKVIHQWWSTTDWPDFVLEDFDTVEVSPGKFLTTVEVGQADGITSVVSVKLSDNQGHVYLAKTTEPDPQGKMVARVTTSFEPDYVEIDAGREIFDTNRFNNSNRWPTIQYFPGDAKTLKDDGYTLLWVPYFFRRPGEPFSAAFTGAFFRYIHGGISFDGEYAPATQQTGFEAVYRYRFPRYALFGQLLYDQDYDGTRVWEATITRSPLFGGPVKMGMDLKLRYKSILGVDNSAHPTFLVGASAKPEGRVDYCGFNISGSHENAPKEYSRTFSYLRNVGQISWHCRLIGSSGIDFRFYRGSIRKSAGTPDELGFRPNDVDEAKLRLDVPGLDYYDEIYATNTNLNFPLVLPLPSDTLILSRQLKLNVFYDFGRALDAGVEFRSTGLGLIIPLGGDLSGAGALAITRLSISTVLYNRVGDTVTRKPNVLIDTRNEF